jgi:hypothetical protein
VVFLEGELAFVGLPPFLGATVVHADGTRVEIEVPRA